MGRGAECCMGRPWKGTASAAVASSLGALLPRCIYEIARELFNGKRRTGVLEETPSSKATPPVSRQPHIGPTMLTEIPTENRELRTENCAQDAAPPHPLKSPSARRHPMPRPPQNLRRQTRSRPRPESGNPARRVLRPPRSKRSREDHHHRNPRGPARTHLRRGHNPGAHL